MLTYFHSKIVIQTAVEQAEYAYSEDYGMLLILSMRIYWRQPHKNANLTTPGNDWLIFSLLINIRCRKAY